MEQAQDHFFENLEEFLGDHKMTSIMHILLYIYISFFFFLRKKREVKGLQTPRKVTEQVVSKLIMRK